MDQSKVIGTLLSQRSTFLAYAWSVLRDEHAAEDVFQEVMLLAVERSDTIENSAALIAWTRTAIRFRAFHWIRDHKREPMSFSDDLTASLDAQWDMRTQISAEDKIAALQKCLNKLTPRSRHIVALRYGDGLTGLEVAKTLGRTARTIYMALSRIHSRLRDCVQIRLTEKM